MGIVNNKYILYKYSKSFFWASNFLPKYKLRKVINIYSFCRIRDDIVDEGLILENLKEYKNLLKIIKSYGINKLLINQLIDGIHSDVKFERYKSYHELIRYCYKVAGVVGLMMFHVLEIKNEKAKCFAIDLGIAMQLTNIARDLMEDFKKNRIYIPIDTGINEEILNNLNIDNKNKIIKIIQDLILKANIYYKSSLNGIRYIPIKSRLSILVALRLYQGISNKINNTGFKFLTENIYLTKNEIILITIKTIIEFLFFFILPVHSKDHNNNLHKPLMELIDAHKH